MSQTNNLHQWASCFVNTRSLLAVPGSRSSKKNEKSRWVRSSLKKSHAVQDLVGSFDPACHPILIYPLICTRSGSWQSPKRCLLIAVLKKWHPLAFVRGRVSDGQIVLAVRGCSSSEILRRKLSNVSERYRGKDDGRSKKPIFRWNDSLDYWQQTCRNYSWKNLLYSKAPHLSSMVERTFTKL